MRAYTTAVFYRIFDEPCAQRRELVEKACRITAGLPTVIATKRATQIANRLRRQLGMQPVGSVPSVTALSDAATQEAAK